MSELLSEKETQDQEIIKNNIGKILEGHALDVLKQFPDESIDCIITSPPYFNARDYGTRPVAFSDGWVGELGLEPTMKQFINHLCEILDECKRVLKKSGTMWINIGDGSSSGAPMTAQERLAKEKQDTTKLAKQKKRPKPKTHLPPKCLLGIPFRFALEMIDNRGWILRNTIIWYKRNASPSRSKTKFTTDFEYVFFFVKSQQYDFRQILEPLPKSTIQRAKGNFISNRKQTKGLTNVGQKKWYDKVLSGEITGKNKRTVWDIPTENNPEYIEMAKRLNSNWRKDLSINPDDYANLDDLFDLSRENEEKLIE